MSLGKIAGGTGTAFPGVARASWRKAVTFAGAIRLLTSSHTLRATLPVIALPPSVTLG